jgi:hypothetical protein
MGKSNKSVIIGAYALPNVLIIIRRTQNGMVADKVRNSVTCRGDAPPPDICTRYPMTLPEAQEQHAPWDSCQGSS